MTPRSADQLPELIALEELMAAAGEIDEAEYRRRFRRGLADVRSVVWQQTGMIPITNPVRQAGMIPAISSISSMRSMRSGPISDYYATRLRDGTLGHFQRDIDDCLRAALASLLQIPMPSVPDVGKHLSPEMDPEEFERVAVRLLDRWITERGLRVRFHASPRTSGRWIGVIGGEEGRVLSDHCLLMGGRDCLFDPMSLSPRPLDQPTDQDLGDIDYAITIERR